MLLILSSIVVKVRITLNISEYKIGDVVISSNLIGSLTLDNGQCPAPGRWIIYGVKQWPV